MKKHTKLTREKYQKVFEREPFHYSEREIARQMEMYDESQIFSKTHPVILPKDMKQVHPTFWSSDSIDDIIEIECDCGEKITIGGGYVTLCPKCGKGYRVISYVTQYEKVK